MKKIIIYIYYNFIQAITIIFPNHAFFNKMRGFLLKKCFNRCGYNLELGRGIIFNCIWNIEIGNNVYISHRCYVNGVGGIYIGDNSIIAPMCVLSSSNHEFNKNGITHIAKKKKISIGRGSYLASNCVVNAGVEIGDNVKIGANSTVIKKCQNNKFYSGVPASEVIK